MYPSQRHPLTNRMPPNVFHQAQPMAGGFPPSYPLLRRSMSYPPFGPMPLPTMTVSFQHGYPPVIDPLLYGVNPAMADGFQTGNQQLSGRVSYPPFGPTPLPAMTGLNFSFPYNVRTPQMDETHKKFFEMENKLSYNLWVTISCLPTIVDSNGIVLRCFGKKVIYVCNPLTYASVPHCNYVQKYCGQKDVLFVGMNPGRNGMAQNGIPFGDPEHVRTFLNIYGNVLPPPGLICDSREKSGHRFWGLMKEKYGTAENFFRNCFVHNYCPLLFLEEGINITLNGIPANKRRIIEEDCDKALQECIEIIRPKIIVAVGDNAEKQIEHIKNQYGTDMQWEKICDPANRNMKAEDWKREACGQLQVILRDPFLPSIGQQQIFFGNI